MKTRHWWLAVAPLVCSVGVVIADNGSAQVDPERLAALRAMTGQARALAERMPEPARRALSSGAMNLMNLAERWPHLEQSLTLRRPAGSRAAPALPREEKASGPPAIPSPGTQVNDPGTDGDFSRLSGFTQSETSTAWCDKNVVVGWNDSGSLFESGGVSFNGYGRSTNSGRIFQDLGFLPTSSGVLAGDPVIGCADTNTFFYASLFETVTTSDISVSKSTNGGFSWGNPVSAVSKSGSTHFLDKPWMAVDPTNTTRIFVTYTDVDDSGTVCGAGNARMAIEEVNSPDGGATWSSPVVVREVCIDRTTGNGAIVQGSQVAVAANGEVYVVWEEFSLSGSAFVFGTEVINSSKSTDHGASWSSPVTVAFVSNPVGAFGPFGLFQGGFRNQEFPTLAVDRSGGTTHGNVYVAWNDGKLCVPDFVSRGGYCYSDIMVSRSTDGGLTYSTPKRANKNREPLESGLGTDQFMPGIAVNKNGKVAICFYDRRNDPRNFAIGRTCAVSTNAGSRWSETPVATDGWPSVVGQDLLIDPTYMGDYDSLASDFLNKSGGFIGAFGENSQGEPNVRAKKF